MKKGIIIFMVGLKEMKERGQVRFAIIPRNQAIPLRIVKSSMVFHQIAGSKDQGEQLTWSSLVTKIMTIKTIYLNLFKLLFQFNSRTVLTID